MLISITSPGIQEGTYMEPLIPETFTYIALVRHGTGFWYVGGWGGE